MINDNQALRTAIDLARQGNKLGAFQVLRDVLQRNPSNVQAWYLLSQVVDDRQRAIQCLQRALKLEPDNLQVKKRLEALKTAAVEPPVKKTAPISQKKSDKTNWRVIGALSAVLLIVVCVCMIAALSLRDTGTPAKPQVARSGPSACVPTDNPINTGRVTQVIDGDTIEVEIEGTIFPVRYIGIDTPESNQPYGFEAEVANRELVLGQTVSLIRDASERDRYDRLLRYVFIGDQFVNYELVKAGHARAYTYPPDTSCDDVFRSAQENAQTADLGLWALESNSPPVRSNPVQSGGSTAVCNCTGPDLDCGHFGTHAKAQACYNYCRSLGLGDVFRLDGDDDGAACEGLQ